MFCIFCRRRIFQLAAARQCRLGLAGQSFSGTNLNTCSHPGPAASGDLPHDRASAPVDGHIDRMCELVSGLVIGDPANKDDDAARQFADAASVEAAAA